MKQYQELLIKILEKGVEKESGRANMPNTIGISKGEISVDLKDGFPLLTTKKMYWKGIIHELLWFLRGETNIKYLVDNNVNIWNGDAYRWYLNHQEKYNLIALSQEDFIDAIKNPDFNNLGRYYLSGYKIGDLGKVYGYQWRNQNGVDQVKEVIEGLQKNPYSRYQIINGWNKADFKDMALPPCHLLYQFIVRPLSFEERLKYYADNNPYHKGLIPEVDDVEKFYDDNKVPKFYLDLNMYQRSCDTFLGVPFNIASMSVLLMIMSKVANMIPGVANWIGGDTHLYVDHVPAVKEQLSREPYQLPKLVINKDLKTLADIESLQIQDFELLDYKSHDAIKAELFVGLKKN